MKNNIKDVNVLKKEYKRIADTCQALINSINIYANFMDNYFRNNWEDSNKEVYKEYKEYSDSIISILVNYGWIKKKK